MSGATRAVVRQVLEIVPLVMRILALEVRLCGYTLAPAHFRLLLMLTCRSHDLSELAERQAVSLPTMSNSISTLVERGWVNRVRSPYDRRVVLIELTPAGKAVLSDTRDKVETRLTELFVTLSPGECDQLSPGLEVLGHVLSLGHERPAQPRDCPGRGLTRAESAEIASDRSNHGRHRSGG